MAVSHWGVNAPEAVKLWSRKLMREALRETCFADYMGTSSDSVVQIKEDTSKGPGDRIRTTLRMQLTGDGRQGDSTQEGYEEALVTYTDDIVIDQLRHAVRSGGKMSEQRIPFSVREEARMGLQDWWKDRMDSWFLNQVTGNTAQTDTRYTGNQATSAPDSDHIVYAGVATAESGLSGNSSQIFTLELIDKMVARAKTVDVPIRKAKGVGFNGYVLLISPEQHYDLRRNTATLEWADIQKAAAQGGKINDNPIWAGSLGYYNGCLLKEAYRLPSITIGTNTNSNSTGFRSVLLGAQAAAIAFGSGYGAKRMMWTEELFDYKNQLGVAAGTIGGLKKCVFNSTDFATIVGSSAVSDNAIAASARV